MDVELWEVLETASTWRWFRLVSLAFVFVLIPLGLVGNSLILVASLKFRAFRLDKVTVALVEHLAVCDLVSTLVFMVPGTVAVLLGRWPWGFTFCRVRFYAILFLGHCSLWQICALTTSKLLAILQPFRARQRRTATGHVLGTLVWLISAVPPLVLIIVQPNSFYFDPLRISCMHDFSDPVWTYLLPTISFLFAVVPNIVVLVTTVWLIAASWRIARRGRENLKWQGLLTVIIVALWYCLTYSPNIALNFMGDEYVNPDLHKSSETAKIRVLICSRTLLLNYVSNVFIYTTSVHSFRKFLVKRLWGRARCGVVVIGREHGSIEPRIADNRV